MCNDSINNRTNNFTGDVRKVPIRRWSTSILAAAQAYLRRNKPKEAKPLALEASDVVAQRDWPEEDALRTFLEASYQQ